MITNRKQDILLLHEFAKYNNKTPLFSFEGISTWCRVVDVYDADTITVILHAPDILTTPSKFKVRINGIDSCEIRSKDPALKQKALEAKKCVIAYLLGKPIDASLAKFKSRKFVKDLFDNTICVAWLECGGFDKYGRLLADLFVFDNMEQENTNKKKLSEMLIENNMAYAYHGGTKLTEAEQSILVTSAS